MVNVANYSSACLRKEEECFASWLFMGGGERKGSGMHLLLCDNPSFAPVECEELENTFLS